MLSRTTVQQVTNSELETAENKARTNKFDQAISKVTPGDWGDSNEFDPEFQEEFDKVVPIKMLPEADSEFTPYIYDDTFLNMELALPRNGGEFEFERVTNRLWDKDGLPIGTANDKPILDTRVYEVEFPDGHKTAFAANAIVENLFAQLDNEGNRHVPTEKRSSSKTHMWSRRRVQDVEGNRRLNGNS